MRYLTATKFDIRNRIYDVDNVKLFGVVVDENNFDYSYLNVSFIFTKLVEEIPYLNKTDINADTIIELDTKLDPTMGTVTLELSGSEIRESMVSIYHIRWEHGGFILEGLGDVSRNHKSIFGRFYDSNWYNTVGLDEKLHRNVVRAKWSGKAPTKCDGVWNLAVNGIDYSYIIPKRNWPMGTKIDTTDIIYCELHGCKDGVDCNECEGHLSCGLDCDDWIKANKEWLCNITSEYDVMRGIYKAINEEDFIPGTCGGCL